MVNKKGYLRIIESIIAIVIILIVIVAFLPREKKDIPKTPPEVNLAEKVILKEIANNEEYRERILQMSPSSTPADFAKIIEFMDASLPTLTPLRYAIATCNEKNECVYYTTNNNLNNVVNKEAFDNNGLPKGKNIYIKSTTVAAQDISAAPIETSNPRTGKTIKLYFWYEN